MVTIKHIVYLVLFIGLSASAQDRYLTRTGVVSFEASVPSFEKVEAINTAVTAILDTNNGEFAALVLIKGFRFKNALMEEHFNENYAESDSYPKATFKGKLQDFSISKLKESIIILNLNGVLNFHGQENSLDSLQVNIIKNDSSITISGEFLANASDYDIKIPKIVHNKISKDIMVSFEFKLQKKPSN